MTDGSAGTGCRCFLRGSTPSRSRSPASGRIEGGHPVSLGGETTLDAVLRPSTAVQIVVTAEAPVVDTGSTGLGTNLTQRAIETLPTGRNYSSVVQVAPGISSDADPKNEAQTTITVYGSSGAENAYYIDGVNTTGIEYGFQGKELNYEFIQEVNVKTGGYEAEFGRSTGAIINVITKSGSNEFHGDAFGYFDSDGFAPSRAGRLDRRHGRGIHAGRTSARTSAGTSGRTASGSSPPTTASTTRRTTCSGDLPGQSVKARATWAPASSRSAARTATPRGLGVSGPDDRHGRDQRREPHVERRPAHLQGRQDLGGHDYAARYEGIFGAHWIAAAQASRHEERNSVGPATSAGDVIQYQDASRDFFQTGGFGLIQLKDFRADGVRRLRLPLLRGPLDQGRDRVREGRGGGHQARIGRTARHDLRQHRRTRRRRSTSTPTGRRRTRLSTMRRSRS